MIKVVLFGNGKMASEIKAIIENTDDIEVSSVFDFVDGKVCDISEKHRKEDENGNTVLIDFSHKEMHDSAIRYALDHSIPIVCGTTGLSETQITNLTEAGNDIPVVYSTNYSYGILVMKQLLKEATKRLEGWDIELIETHHNKKVDAPSGTANTLLEVIKSQRDTEEVYGRCGMCGERKENEIGVHSVRGGTIAGIHTVRFFGKDETIELTHSAVSRRIFAQGACEAAKKLVNAEKGYYTFEQLMI